MLAERWNLNCESPSTRSLQRQIVKMAGPIGQRWQLCSTRWRTPSAPSSRGFRLFLRRRTLIDGNSTACTQQPSQSAVWIRMPVYSISTQPAEELSCPVSHQAHPRSPPMPQGSNPPSRCGDETSGGRSELERCPASGPLLKDARPANRRVCAISGLPHLGDQDDTFSTDGRCYVRSRRVDVGLRLSAEPSPEEYLESLPIQTP